MSACLLPELHAALHELSESQCAGFLSHDEQGHALVVRLMSVYKTGMSLGGLSWVAGNKPMPGHCTETPVQALPALSRTL